MKKLVLFIIGFVLLGSNAKVHSQGISLNGVPYAKAYKMIKFYQDNRKQDNQPTKQSMWFSAENFKLIVGILEKEQKNSKGSAHPTDGLRIYFASNPGTGPGRLRNTIILVSTQDYGVSPQNAMMKLHEDYYDHDAADVAALTNIQTKLYKKHFYRRGEKLYKNTNNSDASCTDPGPHYIDRGKAEQMVGNFGFDTIRTNGEWFDIEFLKSFVNDVHPHDGVRLYFAKHAADEPDDLKRQTVANKEAFIWVPTEKVGWLITTHRDYFDCSTSREFYKSHFALTPGGGPGGQDNGELCPSNCNPVPPVPPAGG